MLLVTLISVSGTSLHGTSLDTFPRCSGTTSSSGTSTA